MSALFVLKFVKGLFMGLTVLSRLINENTTDAFKKNGRQYLRVLEKCNE